MSEGINQFRYNLIVNGHRKQLRVTEYQQNCFLCLAFIDAR